MKFCDKLAKQRKNNNLSQEQLADKLNVSRQAVSKWESSASYPDMEKIIQMTKILNCTLEDLLDDGTISNNNQPSKLNFNNYLQDLLSFITKSYNMFFSMKFIEKIKFLFEMSIVAITIFIVSLVVYATIDSLILQYLLRIPFFGYDIKNIFNSLTIILLIIIGIIILIHLFKIRYLDYFVTIEDSNVHKKTIEKPIDSKNNINYQYQKPSKEKIIIRDPKHSIMSFYNIFLKMINLIMKIFAIFIIVPLIFIFIFLIILSVISIYHIIYSIIFLFIFSTLLGMIIICYCIIKFLYDFITNNEINFKRIFILSIISLITIGVSIGLTCINLLNYNYKNDYSNLDSKKTTKYISINNNTIIHNDNHMNNDNILYVIDNSIEENKAKVEITSIEEADYDIYKYYDTYLITYDIKLLDAYKLIINDLKHKIIRDYDISNFSKIKIYLTENTYNILKENNTITN